jgi:hypothetical protein
MLNYTRLIGGRVPSPSESLATYGSTFAERLPNRNICTAAGEPGCSRPQLAVTWTVVDVLTDMDILIELEESPTPCPIPERAAHSQTGASNSHSLF